MNVEASLRADRITPELIGRKVVVETSAVGATGTVQGYRVTAERSAATHIPTVASRVRLLIDNVTITVDGRTEIRVLT